MNLLPATTRFDSPWEDPRYTALPACVRSQVDARLKAMQRLASAKRVRPVLHAIVREHGGNQAARGWGFGTVQSLWYRFQHSGGDWILVDKAKAGSRHWNTTIDGMPGEFIDHIAALPCWNQRGKAKSAFAELVVKLEAWRAGDAKCKIPGYDSPPPNNGNGLPHGWSYENLCRITKRMATDYSRKLIQVGPKAASALAPKKNQTREFCEVGEFFIFDDWKLDVRGLFRGKSREILGLTCLDYRSAFNMSRFYKAVVEDEEGTKQKLKGREMILLAASILENTGYRPAGTTFVLEKATATLPARVMDILDSATDGKMVCETGPRGGGPGVAGLFADWSGGNPRWKAALESWFNLFHNRCANQLSFPGQTGKDRLSCPEGMFDMAKWDEALYNLAQILPPEKRNLIQYHALQYPDLIRAIEAVVEIINTRREHKIEGWKRCGYVVPAFRAAESMPWLPFTLLDKLTDGEREHVKVLLSARPELVGEVAMNPREAFLGGAQRLRKFTLPQVAMLIAEVPGEERSVQNGLIEVGLPEIDQDEPLLYGPDCRDGQGREFVFRNGEKYFVRPNPVDPRRAWLYDAKGGWIGYAPMWGRAPKGNEAALQEQFKRASKFISHATHEARQLAAPISRRHADIAKHNAGIIRAEQEHQQALAAAAESALLRSQD